ncbi:MAG: histidine phosphatase family protein [Rhodospirillaceae bacterium]|nr:histidine phosphatase family protein [Rhodospirillaceae bacterium]
MSAALAESDERALWQALKSGEAFALMRHALAPGSGDPAEFTLGDCSTQRNLNEEGRAQARAIGARFRANGLKSMDIHSSQWCRCQETARLMELGPVNELPALNSFYEAPERGDPQTAELKSWLGTYKPTGPLLLVAHFVTASALLDAYPDSGEVVVAKRNPDGSFMVLGSL